MMNGYNFTERVRKVLSMAREEAGRLHHEYVGTEHLLLGMLREGEGVGVTVLQNAGIDVDRLASKLEASVKHGETARSAPDLPYTSRAKKVLELAMDEARGLNHSYVGTEHLLLGLVREGDGVAAKVLSSLNVELTKVRSAVEFIIGRGDRIVLGE
ncbi:MAG: Clp protease N-terminal domain-containing protein, partial [Gemmatimonadales bacterium]